jgi:predicted nucleotidyltransferase
MSVHTISDIKTKIAPVAAKYGLARVYVFGSAARGDGGGKSDLDLLVDLTGSKVVGFDFGGLYSDLSDVFGAVDVVTTRALSQYASTASEIRFNDNVLKERVLVYERQRQAVN